MPYFYAPECFANVADNGGATAKGVTKDTITVVVYLAPDTDPIIDFITAPIKNNDTADTDQATYEGYTQMFNEYFQTYGRKVVLKFLHGSGTSDNEVQARADAVKAVDELGAFAVWGGRSSRRHGPRRSRPEASSASAAPTSRTHHRSCSRSHRVRSRPTSKSRSTSPRSSTASPRSSRATMPSRRRPARSVTCSRTPRAPERSRTPPP